MRFPEHLFFIFIFLLVLGNFNVCVFFLSIIIMVEHGGWMHFSCYIHDKHTHARTHMSAVESSFFFPPHPIWIFFYFIFLSSEDKFSKNNRQEIGNDDWWANSLISMYTQMTIRTWSKGGGKKNQGRCDGIDIGGGEVGRGGWFELLNN